jgi:hypothetical protein
MADFFSNPGGFFPLTIAVVPPVLAEFFFSTSQSGFFCRLLQIFQPALVTFLANKLISATN